MSIGRGPWNGEGREREKVEAGFSDRERPIKSRVLLTLEDCVKAERDLWAFCRNCGRATRVRTKELVIKLDFVSLKDAARSMRCLRCTHRACVLLPDRKWPDRN